jgi:phage terminase large subunit
MEIHFSDKFDPLFDILDCWNECSREDFTKVYNKEEQEYWLALKGVDTVLNTGSRDSGKTFVETTWIPIAVKDYGHRVLLTRYVMGTTDQSVAEALDERIEMLQMEEDFYSANNTYILSKNKNKEEDDEENNDGKIFITGQKTASLKQTAKLKSIENFSIFVTEEGEELVSYEEWSKTKKSIRAKDVQCIALITMNPPTREHFVHERFFEDMEVAEDFCGIKDNVMYIHTTYKDNVDSEGNSRLAEHNLKEYDELEKSYNEYEALSNIDRSSAPPKLKRRWREYKADGLGEWRDLAEGVIYENWELGEFNKALPYIFGLDFGFSDPDALVRLAVDHGQKKIYVKEEHTDNETGTDDLINILINRCGRQTLIIADAQHKRLINDIYLKGVNIRRCKKGGGSVLRTIKTLDGYTLIIDPKSFKLQKALRNYAWKDRASDVPQNKWKHFPDAMGYAAMWLIL